MLRTVYNGTMSYGIIFEIYLSVSVGCFFFFFSPVGCFYRLCPTLCTVGIMI